MRYKRAAPRYNKVMRELERTYLLKNIPDGFREAPRKEILDIYIPTSAPHPVIRIRKVGDRKEITKKVPNNAHDASDQTETTIPLSDDEYAALAALPGKRVHKNRYYLDRGGRTHEIDVFQGALKGLVLVDVEFASVEEKNDFAMPDFCLAEVTQEDWCAGGILCGLRYEDLAPALERFKYQKA